MTHATDTPRDDEAGDWQDRLIAAAATVTIDPRSTSEPIRLERLPSWLNFDGLIDVAEAERRFELARQGRAFLPALAAWKREVLGLLHSGEPDSIGDDAAELFWGLSGVSALGDVLLEIGWVGGDDESQKAGTVDVETLDAYTAELHDPTDRGPHREAATMEAADPPVELPSWVNLDALTRPAEIDQRRALALRGRAILPLFAAWVRDTCEPAEWPSPSLDLEDSPVRDLIHAHMGLAELDEVIDLFEELDAVFRAYGPARYELMDKIRADHPELFGDER